MYRMYRKTVYDTYKQYKRSPDTRTMDEICKHNANFELQVQQKFLKEYTVNTPDWKSLLLYHELGSGKTCTAISIAEEQMRIDDKFKALVLLPARLKTNFLDELMTDCVSDKYLSKSDLKLLMDPKVSKKIKTEARLRFEDKVKERYTIMSFDRLKINAKKTRNRSVSDREKQHLKNILKSVSDREKQHLKNILNSVDNIDGRLIKIVLGSPSIKEGVSFKHVQHMHLLDPVWNLSAKSQVEGRVVRFCSHVDIDRTKYPDLYRKVVIHTYVSVPREDGLVNVTCDEIIYYRIIPKKAAFVRNGEEYLKKIAIDYYLFRRLYRITPLSSPQNDESPIHIIPEK